MTDTMLTHNGITQPITEWALDYGIYPNVITDRLARGWTTGRAITTPMIVAPRQRLSRSHMPGMEQYGRAQRESRPLGPSRTKPGEHLTYDGRCLSIREWSELVGVGTAVIDRRIRDGWPLERVLGPLQRTGLIEHEGLKLTSDEWAKRTGIAASTIRRRIKDGWSAEHALTASNMSGKGRVVQNFVPSKGTGGGSVAQDIPQIEFSE